ncbi:MAG: hypothetical protein EXR34_07440 [Rhodoferax sp.]|nr:hypothetical protein [Rhodoferax sp.]
MTARRTGAPRQSAGLARAPHRERRCRAGPLPLVASSNSAQQVALLQAGSKVADLPTLANLVRRQPVAGRRAERRAAVFFKKCAWAGWDLAAFRCAIQTDRDPP